MLKKIAIGLLAAVTVLVGTLFMVAATRPDTFEVRRTLAMQAPPERIISHLDDFHRWHAWSPFEKQDKAMKKTFSGADSGKGAVYEWEGDENVGKGRMEITEATPTKVVIKLDFEKPFSAHNIAEFTLAPKGASTDVTWSMHGPNLFIGKLISVFMSMDAMVGKDFESGLASLKGLAEKE